jgi:hypothetical protein
VAAPGSACSASCTAGHGLRRPGTAGAGMLPRCMRPCWAHTFLYELAGLLGDRHLSGVAGLCGALLAAWWGFVLGQEQRL